MNSDWTENNESALATVKNQFWQTLIFYGCQPWLIIIAGKMKYDIRNKNIVTENIKKNSKKIYSDQYFCKCEFCKISATGGDNWSYLRFCFVFRDWVINAWSASWSCDKFWLVKNFEISSKWSGHVHIMANKYSPKFRPVW